MEERFEFKTLVEKRQETNIMRVYLTTNLAQSISSKTELIVKKSKRFRSNLKRNKILLIKQRLYQDQNDFVTNKIALKNIEHLKLKHLVINLLRHLKEINKGINIFIF
jgi:hypothetical protein